MNDEELVNYLKNNFPSYTQFKEAPLKHYSLMEIVNAAIAIGRYAIVENILYENKNKFDEIKYDIIDKLGFIPRAYNDDKKVFYHYAEIGKFDIAVTHNFYDSNYDSKIEEYEEKLNEAAARIINKIDIKKYLYNKYIVNEYIKRGNFDEILNSNLVL